VVDSWRSPAWISKLEEAAARRFRNRVVHAVHAIRQVA
jgi:hypothetical protein